MRPPEARRACGSVPKCLLAAGPFRGLQGAALWGVGGILYQLGQEEVDAYLDRARAAALRRAEGGGEEAAPTKAVVRGAEAEAEAARLGRQAASDEAAVGHSLVTRLLNAEPGDLGSGAFFDRLPSWLPMRLESSEQVEERLKARLEEIERALERDDVARRRARS